MRRLSKRWKHDSSRPSSKAERLIDQSDYEAIFDCNCIKIGEVSMGTKPDSQDHPVTYV